jgi:hypothetical protein
MKRIFAPLACALLAAAVPGVASAQSDDAAELTEARAIVAVIFPPAERDAMMKTLMQQIVEQVEAATPLDIDALGDPGLTRLIADYRAGTMDQLMPLVKAHLPKILEATAVAYTHEFGLAELREIHAFAETPAGRHYLSRSTALVGDPAVAEANTAYFRQVQTLTLARQAHLKAQLVAYVKDHPEVAEKLVAAVKAARE